MSYLTGFEDVLFRLESWFSRQLAVSVGGFIAVFSFFFVKTWTLSGSDFEIASYFNHYVSSREVAELLATGSTDYGFLYIFVSTFQNAGGQFFLFPFFELLGWSPLTVKIVQVAVLSAAAGVLFLGIERKFNWYTALAAVIVFATLENTVFFRDNDQHFIYLISSVFLYIFIRWKEEFNTKFIFLMGFLAGIGLYVKASVLFPVFSLFIATFILERKKVGKLISYRVVAGGIFSFFLGSLFFWLPKLIQSFTSTNYGNPDIGTLVRELTQSSYNHSTSLVALFNHKLHNIQNTFTPYYPVSNIGFEIGAFGLMELIYLLMFVSGVLLALKSAEERVYAAALFVGILFPLYLGADATFRHYTAFTPLAVLLFSYNLEFLSKISETHLLGLIASLFFLLMMVYGMFHVVQLEDEVLNDRYLFTYEKYSDLEDFSSGDYLITNSGNVYMSSRFYFDSHETYFLRDRLMARWVFNEQLQIEDFEGILEGSNSTVILRYDMAGCDEGFHCGYETDYILEQTGFERYEFEEEKLGNQRFLVYKNHFY